jgi:hypothetical protein
MLCRRPCCRKRVLNSRRTTETYALLVLPGFYCTLQELLHSAGTPHPGWATGSALNTVVFTTGRCREGQEDIRYLRHAAASKSQTRVSHI